MYTLIWKIQDSARTVSGHDAPFFLVMATSGQPGWYIPQMTAWPKGAPRNSNLILIRLSGFFVGLT